MIVEALRPEAHGEWDAYVDTHPRANCYHLRAWEVVARTAYHHETCFLLAREQPGAKVCGALPLFVVKAWRAHLSNGLFGAYADVLADTPELGTLLLREAKRQLERFGIRDLYLKCLETEPPAEEGFVRSDRYLIATRRLDPDPERLWRSLRDKIRNCVRKAQAHRLELRTGPEQLEPFYGVLAENMHHKGSPIYGLTFMRTLHAALGPRADIVTLWHAGRTVSGAFVTYHRDVAYVPFASSLPSALPMRPNNLLYWEVLRRACLRGCTTFDFGRSQRDTGALAFKLGWGAETRPQPCYAFSAEREAVPDSTDQRIRWFVRSWKHLPRAVSDRVGPWICGNLAGFM